MRTSARVAIAVLCAAGLWSGPGAFADELTTLSGAGATFPDPIYTKWFAEYHKIHGEVRIDYQAIGSGGGIRKVSEGSVDFGASDSPMSDLQLQLATSRILHIPMVLGAVVPIVNIQGVTDLKLTGPVLADIFLGKITRWNDPAILRINHDAPLPDAPITAVHRSNGSGTTFVFTDYLTKVSGAWARAIGRGNIVDWPVGLGANGNLGVTALVKETRNSIGYVELTYAMQNGLFYAAVQNHAGKFIKADMSSVSAAAAGVKMPADYRVSITDAAGPNAYPISSFTWILVYAQNPAPKGAILKEFLTWALESGQGMASDLSYAPLPAQVRAMVERTIASIGDKTAG
jgi:phosphate transport system substrate-binding protein